MQKSTTPRKLVYYVATTVDGLRFEAERFQKLIRALPSTFPAHLRQVRGVARRSAVGPLKLTLAERKAYPNGFVLARYLRPL